MTLKHGHNRGKKPTRIYQTWASMIARCYTPSNSVYRYYGGRGIAVCPRWRESFQAFLADMGDPPKSLSIDRIDSNGNYEPGNCRWATRVEQSRNRSGRHLITLNSKTQCLSAWLEELSLPKATYKTRRRIGWDVIKALTTPSRPRKGNTNAAA